MQTEEQRETKTTFLEKYSIKKSKMVFVSSSSSVSVSTGHILDVHFRTSTAKMLGNKTVFLYDDVDMDKYM